MNRPTRILLEDEELKEISNPIESLITPSSSERYFVPKVFYDQIELHYIKSTLPELRSPLILAIQGETGQGKTFQCLETLSQMGIHVLLVSGFELAGKYEGSPVRKMNVLYEFALQHQNEIRLPTALLIDDFDNSIVSIRTTGQSGYSVNSQLLTDYFMNLPNKILNGKIPVPIVLTGNNFRDIYEPLARYGRITFFDWNGPTGEDKVRIVQRIFSDILSPSEQERIGLVLRDFSECSLSFFNELKNTAHDNFILETRTTIGSLNIPELHKAIKDRKGQVTISDLLKIGQTLLRNRPKDFLVKAKATVNTVENLDKPIWLESEGESRDE